MALDLRDIRGQRVLAAAARLAGIYVIGGWLLVIPFMFLPYGGLPSRATVATLGGVAAIPFALAFILLAVARRAGFVALWALLGALWVAAVVAHDLPVELLIAFVAWSVLALPLHFLTAIGIPPALQLRIPGARLSVSALATILWTLMLVPAVAILYWSPRIMHPEPHDIFLRVNDIASIVWGPGPLVLIALSIAHAWAGTRPNELSASGGDEFRRRHSRTVLSIPTLMALAVALGVVAYFTTAARLTRPPVARAIIVPRTASEYGMRILRPDMSSDPMPCLESRDADSAHHAGLPGLGRSPCQLKRAGKP